MNKILYAGFTGVMTILSLVGMFMCIVNQEADAYVTASGVMAIIIAMFFLDGCNNMRRER